MLRHNRSINQHHNNMHVLNRGLDHSVRQYEAARRTEDNIQKREDARRERSEKQLDKMKERIASFRTHVADVERLVQATQEKHDGDLKDLDEDIEKQKVLVREHEKEYGEELKTWTKSINIDLDALMTQAAEDFGEVEKTESSHPSTESTRMLTVNRDSMKEPADAQRPTSTPAQNTDKKLLVGPSVTRVPSPIGTNAQPSIPIKLQPLAPSPETESQQAVEPAQKRRRFVRKKKSNTGK